MRLPSIIRHSFHQKGEMFLSWDCRILETACRGGVFSQGFWERKMQKCTDLTLKLVKIMFGCKARKTSKQ